MNNRKQKLADYAATFCVNVAAIGAGIAMFSEDKIITAIIAACALVLAR